MVGPVTNSTTRTRTGPDPIRPDQTKVRGLVGYRRGPKGLCRRPGSATKSDRASLVEFEHKRTSLLLLIDGTDRHCRPHRALLRPVGRHSLLSHPTAGMLRSSFARSVATCSSRHYAHCRAYSKEFFGVHNFSGSSPLLPSHPLPLGVGALGVGPLESTLGVWGALKAPPVGSWAKPQRTTILVLFQHLERLFLAL